MIVTANGQKPLIFGRICTLIMKLIIHIGLYRKKSMQIYPCLICGKFKYGQNTPFIAVMFRNIREIIYNQTKGHLHYARDDYKILRQDDFLIYTCEITFLFELSSFSCFQSQKYFLKLVNYESLEKCFYRVLQDLCSVFQMFFIAKSCSSAVLTLLVSDKKVFI